MKSMNSFIEDYYDLNKFKSIYPIEFDESTNEPILTNVNDYYFNEDCLDCFDFIVSEISDDILDLLFGLKNYNFIENHLEDMKEIFPELQIGKNGFPTFTDPKFLSELEYDNIIPEAYYEHFDYYSKNDRNHYLLYVCKSKQDFRLLDILMMMANRIDLENADRNEFMKDLVLFKFVYLNKNNEYELDDNYRAYVDKWKTGKTFKTKNATMIVEINGEKKEFNKVTFSVGGLFSRKFTKFQYNLKIRDKKDLYGRSQFKLRSDFTDPSILRSKLISDIHNKLGIPSISANYALLYINDEFMGLYVLTDSYKLSWIEKVYGEKNTTSLYKCDSSFLTKKYCICPNENEDVKDKTEWKEFIHTLDNAESVSDIEDIFDVDQFITEMALEYLLGGWDHINNQHNYYMFKPKNGKWLYLTYDFDLDLGNSYGVTIEQDFNNFFHYEFNIVDILIKNDSSRFKAIIKDLITKVFNPGILYPHIDELKDFIRYYVKLDKEIGPLGYAPGRINKNGRDYLYTLEEWEANTEFTKICEFYGIKYWILEKYRYVCNEFHIKCDPVYMDSNYKYDVNNKFKTKNCSI